MAGKNRAAFAIYPDQATVSEALDSFREAGFRNTDISVLFPENPGSKDLGIEKHTKMPESALAGATAGAILAGAFAYIAATGTSVCQTSHLI